MDDYYEIQRKRIDDAIDDIFGEVVAREDVGPSVLEAFFDPLADVSVDNNNVTVNGDIYAKSCLVAEFTDRYSADGPGCTVPLPPTRNENVTGQEKLSLDVAMLLPEVRSTDKVIVVGSYSENRGGQAYKLLIGRVSVIELYDPYEEPSEETFLVGGCTTVVRHIRDRWDPSKVAVCDVFINDAYDPIAKTLVDIKFVSRVYSVKRFGERICSEGFVYDQIKKTDQKEWRHVSSHRRSFIYRPGLGDCVLCRELGYHSSLRDDLFKTQWRLLHSKQRVCAMMGSSRQLDARFGVPELGVATCKPVYRVPRSGLQYVDVQDLRDVMSTSVKVEVADIDAAAYVVERFIDFEVCWRLSRNSLSTVPSAVCVSVPLPLSVQYHQDVIFRHGDLLYLCTGNRFFGLTIVDSRQESRPIRGWGTCYFEVPLQATFHAIILSDKCQSVATLKCWGSFFKYVRKYVACF